MARRKLLTHHEFSKGRRIYSAEEKDQLWEEFFALDKDSKAIFSQLSEAYLDLVETVAFSKKTSLPNHIEAAELVSAGYIGLADAITKFVPQGPKFETYATHRIHGAIMDYLRKNDKVSRHYRKAFNDLDTALANFLSEHDRQPTNDELAEILGWTEDKLSTVMGMYIAHGEVSLDSVMERPETDFSESVPPSGYVADFTADDPIFNMQFKELQAMFIEVLDTLPNSERRVLHMRIIENMSFEEIANELGCVTTRANALYQSTVRRLIDYLEV